jgi:hypothetical protein
MMTFFPTKGTGLSVQKNTLANVRLEITLAGFCKFASPVAEWTLSPKKLNRAFAFAYCALDLTQTN